jgi:hypothetical protein
MFLRVADGRIDLCNSENFRAFKIVVEGECRSRTDTPPAGTDRESGGFRDRVGISGCAARLADPEGQSGLAGRPRADDRKGASARLD